MHSFIKMQFKILLLIETNNIEQAQKIIKIHDINVNKIKYLRLKYVYQPRMCIYFMNKMLSNNLKIVGASVLLAKQQILFIDTSFRVIY